MPYEAMDPEAIQKALADFPDWCLEPDGTAIARNFKFADFRVAFAFMTECALMAEKLDHHPEWSNVYARVEVRLTTHSARGVTELDFKLAAAMDKAAERRH
ncbi:4a-hydroxytetrahydrobiopterin dehydratase [Rhizobium halophytocola]|uniref:Putative pterin-4-alpha-carbinolamine dehydratase n=1 Tax=Rhizobium halophytocola TaxID=735519 RepID=A0ABS4E2V3_9HYPH|nr:4a-hydroxytetrahydrobiopterin dehydratase [Rhizobium halophytocola]MBP1852284.1 4a-hydroxytetrahydrobiopterin dehydratase [Rhizobium halophytocola]